MNHPKITRTGRICFRWLLASLVLVLPIGCASGSYGPAIVAPSIATPPGDITAPAGSTAKFTAVTAGTGPMTFQWLRNGVAIPSATAGSYTTPALSLTDTGTKFSVKVANRVGSVTSSEGTLTVTAPPTILTQPTNATVLFGTPATFTVLASASAPISYQWYRGTTAIPGATAASYTLPSPQVATDNGAQFYVTITNPIGSITSNTVTLRVVSAIIPLAITAQPASKAVLEGTSTSLSVTADGTGNLAYQWMKGGADISGATTSTLNFSPAALADTGSYSVRITDDFATLTSASATLTVNPLLIVNGGFEAATIAPWVADRTSDLFSGNSSRVLPHGGTKFLYLGNISTAATTFFTYQELSIPATALTADLAFWYAIGNRDATGGVNVFTVEVCDTTGAVLQTLFTKSDLDSEKDASLLAVWKQPAAPFDLTAYKGQTIRIYFRHTQPGAGRTVFAIDDVTLNYTTP